jgi:hypothetical protein
VVPSDAAKRRFIDSLTFDLAVVDGNHFREPVKFDFECVRRCGLVLFHDYPASGTDADGVGYLLDEIRPAGIIERCPPFAWWRA